MEPVVAAVAEVVVEVAAEEEEEEAAARPMLAKTVADHKVSSEIDSAAAVAVAPAATALAKALKEPWAEVTLGKETAAVLSVGLPMGSLSADLEAVAVGAVLDRPGIERKKKASTANF